MCHGLPSVLRVLATWSLPVKGSRSGLVRPSISVRDCSRCCIQFGETVAHKQHLEGNVDAYYEIEDGHVCDDIAFAVVHVDCVDLKKSVNTLY